MNRRAAVQLRISFAANEIVCVTFTPNHTMLVRVFE